MNYLHKLLQFLINYNFLILLLKLHILNNHKTKEERKNEFPYYCELCDSCCMEEKLYKKHLETKKHKKKLDLLSK